MRDRVKAILGGCGGLRPAADPDLVQRLLEEEGGEVLGRARYARREGIDAPGDSRNGLGKPRRLTLRAGTITVRRPRVRGLAERLESRLLPVFKRRTDTVGQLLPTLCLHGLAEGPAHGGREGYRKVENATAVIWTTLLIAERTFRRLDAPKLLAEVAESVIYVNGQRVKPSQTTAEKKAAA